MLHVICTRLRHGHLSILAGDSSRHSEENVKDLKLCLSMRLYDYYSHYYYYYCCCCCCCCCCCYHYANEQETVLPHPLDTLSPLILNLSAPLLGSTLAELGLAPLAAVKREVAAKSRAWSVSVSPGRYRAARMASWTATLLSWSEKLNATWGWQRETVVLHVGIKT